jgi:hypothetical protein
MNYSFDHFSSRVLEVMIALIMGNLPEVIQKRYFLDDSDPFLLPYEWDGYEKEVCEKYPVEGEAEIQKHHRQYRRKVLKDLKDFASSLIDYRFEKMDLLPLDAIARSGKCIGQRFAVCTLEHTGHQKSDVEVKISFDDEDGYFLDEIFCTEHPDEKFRGKTILGYKLEEESDLIL